MHLLRPCLVFLVLVWVGTESNSIDSQVAHVAVDLEGTISSNSKFIIDDYSAISYPPFDTLIKSHLDSLFSTCVSDIATTVDGNLCDTVQSIHMQVCKKYNTSVYNARKAREDQGDLWFPSIEFLNHTLLMVDLLLEFNPFEETLAAGCMRAMDAYYRLYDGPHYDARHANYSAGFDMINYGKVKLKFDSQQLDYLTRQASQQKLFVWPKSARQELRSFKALHEFLSHYNQSAHNFLHEASLTYFHGEHALGVVDHRKLNYYVNFNKLIYNRPYPSIENLLLSSGPVLNPDSVVTFDQGNILVIDNFLRVDVMEEIHKWCLQSSIWHMQKRYYLGALMKHGFSHPLLLRIVQEMREKFPFVKDLALNQMWAFNYDSEFVKGINKHADKAIVNMNFWLTPDDANLDPSNGGLVIFTTPPDAQDTFEALQSGR